MCNSELHSVFKVNDRRTVDDSVQIRDSRPSFRTWREYSQERKICGYKVGWQAVKIKIFLWEKKNPTSALAYVKTNMSKNPSSRSRGHF